MGLLHLRSFRYYTSYRGDTGFLFDDSNEEWRLYWTEIIGIKDKILYEYFAWTSDTVNSYQRAYSGIEGERKSDSEGDTICGSNGEEYESNAEFGKSDIGL